MRRQGLNDDLTRHTEEGGIAGAYLYKKNNNQKYRYINNEVFNALIVRDIIIRNELLLHILMDFLMDNIGNLTSIRSVADVLTVNNANADHKTIGEYLCKSFASYRIRRYDIRGKKHLGSNDKYYLSDHSFKYARLGTKTWIMAKYWRILLLLSCSGADMKSTLVCCIKKSTL